MFCIQQRLAAVRTRIDQIYEDKLEGKIDESFWARKQADYREPGLRFCEDGCCKSGMGGLNMSRKKRALTALKVHYSQTVYAIRPKSSSLNRGTTA